MLLNWRIVLVVATLRSLDGLTAANQVQRSALSMPRVVATISQLVEANGTGCCVCTDQLSHTGTGSSSEGPFHYNKLQFALATASTTSSCKNTSNGLQLLTVTSIISDSRKPHKCAANISCVTAFNTKQLATIKSFLHATLAVTQSPVPVTALCGGEQSVVTTTDLDMQLACANGSTELAPNGVCGPPGNCVCGKRHPLDITLTITTDTSKLTATDCSELNSVLLVKILEDNLIRGQELVSMAGGKLTLNGHPTIDCTDGGSVVQLLAHAHMRLRLAPDVFICSKHELQQLIEDSVTGFFADIKEISVGERNYVSPLNVEADVSEESIESSECTSGTPTTPAPIIVCPAGSYWEGVMVCSICPVGQFTDTADQASCSKCPDGQTTLNSGATSRAQCETIVCPKGHYSATGSAPCTPCPIGQFQFLTGRKSCFRCFGSFTTAEIGATRCISQMNVSPPKPVEKFPEVILETSGGFLTSMNYPKHYKTHEIRSYKLQCPPNHKAAILVMAVSLGYGDQLEINGQVFRSVTTPVSKLFSTGDVVAMVFSSDKSFTGKGFELIYACYDNTSLVSNFVERTAIDCKVLDYLKDRPDVVRKLLRVLNGDISITAATGDADFQPLIVANIAGGVPCN